MFAGFENIIIQKAIKVMSDVVVEIADKIEENTPEDSYELISRNQIEFPQVQGDSIKAKIFNDDPKAKFVEYGQEPKVYNYYKGSGRRKGGSPFYRGSGARMYMRSLEAVRPTLHDKLITIIQK